MRRLTTSLLFLALFCSTAFSQKLLEVEDIYLADSPTTVNALSKNQIENAFKKIKEFGIPFGYDEVGCEARAYAMHLLLDSLKVPNYRIWIFAPSKFISGSTSSLTINNRYEPGKTIFWGYHTAPVVYLKEGDGFKKMIFDLGIESRGPIEFSQWISKIGGYQDAGYILAKPELFLFNQDLRNDRYKISFYKYEGAAYNNMAAEANLAIDHAGRFIYQKYVKNGDPDLKDFPFSLVSNESVLRAFLLRNELPQTADGLTIRKLYERYPSLIKDAKYAYIRAELYWYYKLRDYTVKIKPSALNPN